MTKIDIYMSSFICHSGLWVELTEILSLDIFVKLKVSLSSIMNGFKKRWLSVVRLARARNQSIKIKNMLT